MPMSAFAPSYPAPANALIVGGGHHGPALSTTFRPFTTNSNRRPVPQTPVFESLEEEAEIEKEKTTEEPDGKNCK